MNSRSAIKLLLCFVLGLPVVMAVLYWVVGLLSAMDDNAAATILGHVSTGTGVLWVLAVVGLVIAMAIETLDDDSVEGGIDELGE